MVNLFSKFAFHYTTSHGLPIQSDPRTNWHRRHLQLLLCQEAWCNTSNTSKKFRVGFYKNIKPWLGTLSTEPSILTLLRSVFLALGSWEYHQILSQVSLVFSVLILICSFIQNRGISSYLWSKIRKLLIGIGFLNTIFSLFSFFHFLA